MVTQIKSVDFSQATGNITKELIFSKFTDEEIFRHYLGKDFKVGKSMTSPLRDDDNTPSFSIYQCKDGRLRFKDFKYDELRGDCIALVCILLKVSYSEALKIILNDLSRGRKIVDKTVVKGAMPGADSDYNSHYPIVIQQQPYTFTDEYYWKQRGVSVATLFKFNIYSCKNVYFGANVAPFEYNSNNPIYAYTEKPESNDCRFMIYRPYGDKTMRFRNNLSREFIFGDKQLPDTGDLLIITKSMKDVAAFHDMGYPAVSSKSEVTMIPMIKVMQYQKRFKEILTCFDPDATGKILADKYRTLYGFKGFEFPPVYKDCSGMIFGEGASMANIYIKGKISDIREASKV